MSTPTLVAFNADDTPVVANSLSYRGHPTVVVSPHVATAEGYATEIANELTTYKILRPSPFDLLGAANNKVAAAKQWDITQL